MVIETRSGQKLGLANTLYGNAFLQSAGHKFCSNTQILNPDDAVPENNDQKLNEKRSPYPFFSNTKIRKS